MQPIQQPQKHELVAAFLLDGINAGRWSKSLPGVLRLAAELDVSPHTIRRALRQLETTGAITDCGLGRSRNIVAPGKVKASPRKLRVAILRHDAHLVDNPQTSLVLTEIMHSLEAAGHEAYFCKKSQIELKHDIRRTTLQLGSLPADAWIVEAGSRELLEWCATQPTPCLALYGPTGNLQLARTGPDMQPAFRAAMRHLLSLGHRRIVFIVNRPARKLPVGSSALTFLEELTAHGTPTGEYNLPDWEETPKGFNQLLETLFQRTPPTALIITEIPRLLATLAFLARHGIQVPEQVSLVSTDCDALLDWCHPGIAHMQWDNSFIVRRAVRWVESVRKGKSDCKVINAPARFVPGASTSPVRKR